LVTKFKCLFSFLDESNSLRKREEFAISLRKKKKAEVLKEKRRKFILPTTDENCEEGEHSLSIFCDLLELDFEKGETRPDSRT
jgi:hypothetical protein